MTLPPTIKHHEAFKKSPSAGFDGVFDWSWTSGCFGDGNITPMDFDGVVERKGNFLIMETKGIGVPVPKGQIFTMESAFKLNVFTILFIQGKQSPELAKAWCQPGFRNGVVMNDFIQTDSSRMQDFLSSWYEFADKNPAKFIDVTFLNKKICSLSGQIDQFKHDISVVVKNLGGTITW